MATPIDGAWELVADDDEGLLLITGNHYSVLFVDKKRREKMTDEEMNRSLRHAAAGKVSIEGNVATFRILYRRKRYPTITELAFDFELGGESLLLKGEDTDYRYRKAS